ncbi:porin family protein [Pedobacter sp. JCM 36344]|uniref:porin family protein n=1 Tax=Pedobacter sp. JCM 36344 TaxID=3374280 RepID=UPI00397E66C7
MKRTFIGLILLFLTGSVFAQDFSSPYYGFRLGLTAHPTIGWLKPDIGKSNGVSLGFSYGLIGDFNFTQNYSFATGLTITTVNGKSTEIVTSNSGSAIPSQAEYELKYKIQYVEVPLTLKLKTVKINEVRYFGQFGLSNGILIGAKQDADMTGGASRRDINIKDDIKFYRAGLIIGAGAEFEISENTSITTGLTFNNGFTDITSSKSSIVRNHYVSINFGFFF